MVRNKGQNMGIFNHPWSLSSVTISLHLALIKSSKYGLCKQRWGITELGGICMPREMTSILLSNPGGPAGVGVGRWWDGGGVCW